MWEFATNEDGSLDGWNDGDIANFKSNVFKNLAREIIQNSIDARFDKNSPVTVTFELQKLPRACIPDLDTIKDHMEYIQENSAHTEGDAYKKEISETLRYSKMSQLPVLIISDENTSGMPDTEQKNSVQPFLKYMKSKGSSGGDQNRAGSHGIGKAAPLATTPLRTIYVGTMWKEQSGIKTLYQGRARLMYRKIQENGIEKIEKEEVGLDVFLLLRKPKYSNQEARDILTKKKNDLDLQLITQKQYDSIKNKLSRYITD